MKVEFCKSFHEVGISRKWRDLVFDKELGKRGNKVVAVRS